MAAMAVASAQLTVLEMGGQFSMTLKVIHRLQAFFKCNPSNICAAFYTILTECARAVPLRYLSFLFNVSDFLRVNSAE